VFAAYADVNVRTRWGVPSDAERIEYLESSFWVGGSDVYRCGPRAELKYRGHVRYEHIVVDDGANESRRRTGAAAFGASAMQMR
jgi:hypothetical protein